jgi:hypothetical protein
VLTDLAPISDFSPNIAPTFDVAFSGREAVAIRESTGNPSGAYDKGMHADQTTATDVFSTAPVGAPTFATCAAPGLVNLHVPSSDLLTEIIAPPPERNEPTTGPSLPHITDGLIYQPGGTPSSTPVTHAGATAAQLLQALDASGLSVNGSGIKVGVLSDSFN